MFRHRAEEQMCQVSSAHLQLHQAHSIEGERGGGGGESEREREILMS